MCDDINPSPTISIISPRNFEATYTITMPSRFNVSTKGVKEEARFYRDAEEAHEHLEDFKRQLGSEEQNFDMLMQYYRQNSGRLDTSAIARNGGSAAGLKPNLGTDDESWYYLDGHGNKIWVQNLKLDVSDPRVGAFETNEHSDGRVVVVKVPTHKKNFSLLPDYKKRCVEYDAYREAQQRFDKRSGRARSTQGLPQSRRGYYDPLDQRTVQGTKYPLPNPYGNHLNSGNIIPSSPGSRGRSMQHQQHSSPNKYASATPSTQEAYIASQKDLAQNLATQERSRPWRPASAGAGPASDEYVFRPPTSLEEAEERLRELKQEEAYLMEQMVGVPPRRY